VDNVPKIIFSLKSKACQEGRINGVKWLEKANGETLLVAIASEGALIIWKVPENLD